jgi:hypothetical protein
MSNWVGLAISEEMAASARNDLLFRLGLTQILLGSTKPRTFCLETPDPLNDDAGPLGVRRRSRNSSK